MASTSQALDQSCVHDTDCTGTNEFCDVDVCRTRSCNLLAPFDPPELAFTGTGIASGLTFSQDQRTAYVSSKTSPSAPFAINFTSRLSTSSAFDALTPVTALNSGPDDHGPALSDDGLTLYLTKLNSSNWTYDLAKATRTSTEVQFDNVQFLTALNNSSFHDQDPFFLSRTSELYYASEWPTGTRDLYVSKFDSGVYQAPTALSVNLPSAEDFRPVLSRDGLTLYFASSRPGIGNDTESDIWMARRSGVDQQFGSATNLFGLNSSYIDFPVALADGDCTLYFGSTQDTGSSSWDSRLYRAKRGTSIPSSVTTTLQIIGSGSVNTPPFQCSTSCSAQGAPDSTIVVQASGSAHWHGSCTSNGGEPSSDGVLVFTNGGVCTVDFNNAGNGTTGSKCFTDANCSSGLYCVSGTCGPACTPSCSGKACGADNGCGAVCDCDTTCTSDAQCPSGFACSSSNQCGPPGGEPGSDCVTDANCAAGLHCSGGKCGGAGATCTGACAPGLTCSSGTCIDCAAPCATAVCGSPDACGGTCPCGGGPGDIGDTCAVGDDCQDGLICYKDTCIAGGCLTNPAALGCGTANSECANWCTPHPICTSDADCPSGYVCPPDNGAAYGLPGQRVCELPGCATQSHSLGCGYVLAECGRCRCDAQCDDKHCGDTDLSDGCGSTCTGVCQVGETGCTRDADCQDGVCREGKCRPVNPCASLSIAPADCGPGDTLCGPCPTLDAATRGPWGDTSTRQCGIDPNTGHDLGSCGATEKCTGDGTCAPTSETPPIQVPDAGGGTRDVTPQPSPPANPVGTITGHFTVSDRGSATYSIPLELPPGGSVMPSLTLRYMSTSGNGAMGAGWSLDGLSEITRCQRTFAEDGFAQPVLGTDKDVFCMDGHRLQPVQSSENRFEYRTAIETFTKVVGLGGVDTPDYFVAYTRDGRILTYGQGAASLAYNGFASVPISWELTRVEDRMGNFMTIDYFTQTTRDPLTGRGSTSEVVPTQISYTGHGTQAGDRLIKFSYQFSRDDVVTGWRPPFSRMFSRDSRLNSIEVIAAGAPVRYYNFGYTVVRGTTLLSSLQECAPYSICKPSTTFDYYDEVGFQAPTVAGLSAGDMGSPSDAVNSIGPYGVTYRRNGVDRISTATIRSYITRVSPYFDAAAFAASFIPDYGSMASSILQYAGSRMDKEHRNLIPFELNVSNNAKFYTLPTPCARDLMPTAMPFDADPLSSGRDEDVQYLCPVKMHTGRIVPGGISGTQQSVKVSPLIWYTDVNGDGLLDKLSCQWGGGAPAVDQILLDLATPSNGVPSPTDEHVDQAVPAFGNMCNIAADCSQVTCDSHGCWEPGTEQECPHVPPFTTLLDVDGDGTNELVVYDHHAFSHDGFSVLMFDINGQGTWHPEYFSDITLEDPDPDTYTFVAMDANGDGLRDLLVLAPWDRTDYPAWVLYNTGHGFRQMALNPDTGISAGISRFAVSASKFPPFVVDYDHDGVDDYLEPMDDEDDQHYWYVRHIKNGVVSWEATNLKGGPGTIGDFNGDGNLDAWTRADGGQFELALGVGRHDHLLKSITDGLGRNISIEYDGGYTRDPTDMAYINELTGVFEPSSGAPRWPEGWPLRISAAGTDHPVVSRHTEGIFRNTSSAYPDLDREVDYDYADWANDVAGYGALGFSARLEVERDGVGVERKRTYYHYDTSGPTLPTSPYTRPLTGLLKKKVEIFPSESDPATSGEQRRIDTVYDWQVTSSPAGLPYPYLASKTTMSGIETVKSVPFSGQMGATIDDLWALANRYEQYGVDTYGNVQDVTITGTDLASIVIHRDFTPTEAQQQAWLISLPNSESITSTAPGCSDPDACEATRRTRYQEFTYHTGTNLVETIHRAPGQPAYDRFTAIDRDDYGNVQTISVTAVAANETRVTHIDYDARKLFPMSVTRIGGLHSQETQLRFDDRFGTITASADPNGIDETWSYDEFGRLRAHHGTDKDFIVDYADDPYHEIAVPSTSIYSKYAVTTTRVSPTFEALPNPETTVEEYSSSGQLVRLQTTGLKDTKVFQEFEYDKRHRLQYAYRPHVENDASQGYETTLYDDLDRVTTHSDASGKYTSYSYALEGHVSQAFAARVAGFDTTFVEDADGRLKSYGFDAAGKLSGVVEGDGAWDIDDTVNVANWTGYSYGAFNLLQSIFINGLYFPHPLDVERDDFGRVVYSAEPAKGFGIATNLYDGFDEVVERMDYAGRDKQLFYDDYGRLDHTIDGDGETHWYYDVDELADGPTDSIGRLVKTTSPSGQTVHYSYMGPEVGRNRGFLARTTEELEAPSVDGTGTTTVNLTTDYNYDDLSRLWRIDYPVAGSQRFSVKYDFDDADNVVKASNYNSNDVYWELLTPEQGVRVQQERLGSAACGTTFGVATAGVVTQRAFDQHTGALNQVQTACGTTVLQDIAYQYSDARRTLDRHDAMQRSSETYGYDGIGRIQSLNNATVYTYRPGSRGLGGALGREYRVQGENNGAYDGSLAFNTYWTGSVDDTIYFHDAAGDQTMRTGPLVAGGSQLIDYTQFDLPKQVTQNSGYIVDFSYDAGGARSVRATDTFSGTPTEVTYYAGDLYQRIDDAGGTTTNRNMIYAGGRLVAVATTTSDTTNDPVVHYVHDDAIGSAQTITSASGTIEAMRRFDPYGVELGGSPRFDLVPYGFTGQEHDVDLGLINMHGRIYDPVLGEFLTPDPLMSNPSGHGINAFAYVENDPLNRVDPSGFMDTTVENLGSFSVNGQAASVAPESETTLSWSGLTGTSAAGSGPGSMAYAFDSPAVGAEDGLDIASGVSDVATGVSAVNAARNFFKHLSPNVHRKPAPHSTAATAPGGSVPSAGRAGPSATQTRTEAAPVQEGPDLRLAQNMGDPSSGTNIPGNVPDAQARPDVPARLGPGPSAAAVATARAAAELAEAAEATLARVAAFLDSVAAVVADASPAGGFFATGDSEIPEESGENAAQRAGRPRTNAAQNQQARDAIREYERQSGRRLTRDEIQQAHREFGRHPNPGYHDLVDILRDTFGR